MRVNPSSLEITSSLDRKLSMHGTSMLNKGESLGNC